MKPVRLVMVGGFLGAGKTTTLIWLARHYLSQGRRVAFVANDQAENLVDTSLFRTVSPAREVAGGCFCCRLEDFLKITERLRLEDRPDLILAEPVGSCTDLVATVVQPLKRLYQNCYQVAPFVVLTDPHRAGRILSGDQFGGFSAKVAYLFQKQLEEADAIAVNKCDLLTPTERQDLMAALQRHFPEKRIFFVSARTGENMDELVRFQEQDGRFGVHVADVDYDIYAAAEAELGWLNVTARLSSRQAFMPDQLLYKLIARIQERLQTAGAEIAHLKGLLHTSAGLSAWQVVHLTGQPQLTRSSAQAVQEAQLVLNARVASDPEVLWQAVKESVERTLTEHQVEIEWQTVERFRPARPVPVMRFAEAI